MQPNSEKYPEAWAFFIEHTRNIMGLPQFTMNYRVPKPDMSGDFIYSNDVGMLFYLFRQEFYKPSINSHSLYGKIQYVVQNF